ncbi:MAG: hypothetical protein KGZ63_13490 [Clostridiales bacterium]|nr:hypothetical protein [Clostridiales bacterium]
MEEILIVGAGHFGVRAANLLQGMERRITVVDKDPMALGALSTSQIVTVCSEGINFLVDSELSRYAWIVPALPVHVVFSWMLITLQRGGYHCEQIPVPLDIPVPNAYYTPDGTLYASLARDLCPEDCPEPLGYCYKTGEERPSPLYEILKNLNLPDLAVDVVRSHQLRPGVGGLSPAQLHLLQEAVISRRKPGLLATSCGCHAVVNAYQF